MCTRKARGSGASSSRAELKQFLVPELDPLGRKIIEACLDGAHQEDYRRLIPHPMFRDDG